jgi:cyclic pyranopterin phosphate synthase
MGQRPEILGPDEMRRIIGFFTKCGVRKIRLTGGEPLVRENIVNLAGELAGIVGVEELTLTTNGVLLGPIAEALKNAGLKRVNVSMACAERQLYRQITGFDLLPKVIDGISNAIRVGLTPVKINCVVMKDVNVSQIPALAEMSIQMPVLVRFIEYYPNRRDTGLTDYYVPNSEVREIIEAKVGTLSVMAVPEGNGPAEYFKAQSSAGGIGFINGRSSDFCGRCNRLRLSCDGKVRPCLYSAHYYDVGSLVRSGAGDEEILELIKKIMWEKQLYTRLSCTAEDFSMQNLGG